MQAGASRGLPRAGACLVLLAGAAAIAADDEADGLELDDVREYAEGAIQQAVPPPGVSRYRAIHRIASRRDRPGVVDDLSRLAAIERVASSLRVPDADLADRIVAAIGEAERRVDLPERDELSDLIQSIARGGDRARVEASAMRAGDLWRLGHDLQLAPRHSSGAVIAKFRAAARQYGRARDLARRILRRQRATVPRFKTPEPGRIYTVAGNGAGGFNGDGRAARRSSLYFVEETRIGPDGRLYVNDWNNHRIRVREHDGTISPFCGSGVPGDSEGPALDMKFNHIGQMQFAPDGRLFVAVWHNHKIKVYDENGGYPIVYTIAGSWQGNAPGIPDDTVPSAATDARFNLVPGLLLLPAGHPLGGGDLLVTDASNCRVMRVGLASAPIRATNIAGVPVDTGLCTRFFGTGLPEYDGDGGPAATAGFDFSKFQNAQPDGRMELDADGNVYIVMGSRHVIRRVAPDGTVSTFAGDGTPGWSGDGGPATQAQLNFPADIAVGGDGRTIFISDTKNSVIRRVAPDGTISTYAGTPNQAGYSGDDGPADQCLFDNPSGLELDANDNLYVCDRNNHVIRVVTSQEPGDVMLPADPYTLPVRSRGGAPTSGASGTISTLAGTGELRFNGDGLPALDCDLYWPQDLTVEPYTGLVYFSDWNNERIRRIEADGTVTTVAGSGRIGDDSGTGTSVPLNHPTDIAFDPQTGDLWIAAWHTDKILRLDGNTNDIVYMAGGRRGFAGDGGAATQAQLNLPSSVKFDSAGNWYVADEGNRRVRRVDRATNVITTLAGTGFATLPDHPLGDGGPADQATLNFPVGQDAQPAGRICIDPTDAFVYIADTNNHRVRRVDLRTNVIETVAGTGERTPNGTHPRGDGGPAANATLSSPTDVDCDAAGNLYVADRDNHCIRRIDVATGVITTVAGGAGKGYAGDGGPATSSKLSHPAGLYVDRATGRIYIADTHNAVLRVVWE